MSKSSTKTKAATTKKTSSKSAQKHDLIYIMSNSCGWCKKADPIVKELVNDGYKITTLDVMVPEESKRVNELKEKHNAQCGTPLFIDAETGNSVCGFREKDVLEKWAKGEEIPKPPQPKGPPPPPPSDLEDEAQVKEFTSKYEQWAKENDHLPNLLTIEQVLDRLKQSRANANQNQPAATGGSVAPTGATGGASSYQPKFNTKFYYLMMNGKREVVFAEEASINTLQQQYYYQESDGNLTKVVGDKSWTTGGTPVAKPMPVTNGQKTKLANAGAGSHPAKKAGDKTQVSEAVKAKIAEVKKESAKRQKVAEQKSKANTKTIKGL